MFDVIWTDPNVELMGQRMIRKEQEAKEKGKKKAESGRQSVSTNWSSSSSERGFGLFSRVRRKGSTPSGGKPDASSIGQEDSGCDGVKARRPSTCGVKAALVCHDEPETSPKSSDDLLLQPKAPEIGEARPQDSALSTWTHQTAVATGGIEKIRSNDTVPETTSEVYVQALSPSSSITQNIETVVTPRTEADLAHLLTKTRISSSGTRTQSPPLAEVSEDTTIGTSEEHEPLPPPYICPETPPAHESRNNDCLANPEAWKPPHEWDCTPTKPATVNTIDGRLQLSPARQGANYSMFPAFAALQRERQMMAAASSELMLANLKPKMTEYSDGSVYKEIEMTKKRWMFSALHQQGGYARLVDSPIERPDTPTRFKRKRILALYETQASASFLAALYPALSITHLSTNPLSPDLFPNVQPLLVPSVSVSASSRALPPRLYATVTCLSMPALLPSTEIPPFLRHINQCLAPGGALHLTIIDPQPVSASMGPKLRQWLFAHLLIHLERTFHATWPSETFPAWLAAGNLRGKGSTIATITVPAVFEGHAKPDSKIELRCLTGRLLWQEVWGKFVNASRWWWEEEEIVRECVELGTYWQYSHIIAMKGDFY